MKYLEVFREWWFWIIVVLFTSLNIIKDSKLYGVLSMSEYIGIIFGSILGILFPYTIFFGIYKLFKWIFKKKKKE